MGVLVEWFRGEGRAYGCMSGTVFLWSLAPLAVALTALETGPLAYLFWAFSTMSTVFVVWLWFVQREVLRSRLLWREAFRLMLTRHGVFTMVDPWFRFFFIAAVWFVDVALVTVIGAAGTAFLFVVFRARQDRGRGVRRYRLVSAQGWCLLAASGVGVGFVVLSQSGGWVLEGVWWRLPVGVGLSLISVVFASFAAYRLKVGEDLYRFGVRAGVVGDGGGVEVGCLVLLGAVANVLAVAGGLVGALLVSPEGLWVGEVRVVVGLSVLASVGSVLFRYANLGTDNLGVNALMYLSPGLSLMWLWLFATVTVVRADWLVLGAVMVVAVSVLSNHRTRVGSRVGFV